MNLRTARKIVGSPKGRPREQYRKASHVFRRAIRRYAASRGQCVMVKVASEEVGDGWQVTTAMKWGTIRIKRVDIPLAMRRVVMIPAEEV